MRTMPGSTGSRAFALTFACIALFLLNGRESPALGTSKAPLGIDLLKRILRAEERVTYDSTVVLTVWTDGKGIDTVSREYHLGPTRSRIEYVSPAEVAGRLVVNDGQARWEYNPAEHVVVRSPILRRPVAASAIPITLARVQRSYTLLASSPEQRIAGRHVYRLEFRPRLRDRETKVWWVDRDTSIVLRRDMIGLGGRPQQSTVYRRIAYNPQRDPSLVRFAVPRGVRTMRSTSQAQNASTLARARALAPAWAKIPADVGAGFEFDSMRVIRNNGVKTVQVQYSDGLVGLSLFLAPVPTHPASATGGGRMVSLGSTQASIVQPFPPYRVLSWTSGGRTYTIVSDLSEKTLVAIARTLL